MKVNFYNSFVGSQLLSFEKSYHFTLLITQIEAIQQLSPKNLLSEYYHVIHYLCSKKSCTPSDE
jgi:hypothetical protein